MRYPTVSVRPPILVSLVVVGLVASSGMVMSAHQNPTVVATVSVGDAPRGVAVDQDTDRVYVSNQGSDTVSVIDGATDTVVDTIPVGDKPKSLALNPETDRLYVPNGLGRTVSVIDTTTNTVVDTIDLGFQFRPRGAAVNPETNTVYISNAGSGTVSVIDGATNTVVDTIPVGDVPDSVAVNSETNTVYVTQRNGDAIDVINATTNTVVDTIPVGDGPHRVVVSEALDRVYGTNNDEDTIAVIDATTNTVVDTVAVGDRPSDIAVNPATDRVYVTNSESQNVSVLNATTHAVVDSVSVGDARVAGVNPITDRVYVANLGNVSVIADGNAPPSVRADAASVTVEEGATATVNGTVSDPDGDNVTLTASVGTVSKNADDTWTWSLDTTDGPEQSQPVTITATDDDGATSTATFDLTVTNVPPSVIIELDDEGIVDESVSLTATFVDPGAADTHAAEVDWGDGTTESVAVDQASDSLSTTHTYTTGGTFTVELNVTDDDGGTTTVTDSITIRHAVEMDVKPGNGDETDPINPRSDGVIPVVVYTTDGFDASTVNVSSLRFGNPSTVDAGDGATPVHDGHLEDVDDDGDLDLVVHFTGETGLEAGDEEATVVGTTSNGVPLAGTDSVRVVGGNGDGGRNGNGGSSGNGNGNGP